MSFHGFSMRQMKMKPKGGQISAYHSMAHPNNIKWRGKLSTLITNTKLGFGSLLEKKKRRERVSLANGKS